jgi:hypothetical protein
LRDAIESYPEDLKVAIVATGGLSHQVHGARCGFNNPEWDLQFLELFEKTQALTRLTLADYAELGGMEGAEVIMWLIMRGALSSQVKKIHQTYYLPSMTGIATAIYENASLPLPKPRTADLRHAMERELAGAENLTGTHPFTLAASLRTYRLNKFLRDMIDPAHRELFLNNPQAAYAKAGLTDEEADMLERRDWDADPLRRDFLWPGKTGCGGWRVEPAHLRRHAWPDAGAVPGHPQCAGRAVFGYRQGRWRTGLGPEQTGLSIAKPLPAGRHRQQGITP